METFPLWMRLAALQPCVCGSTRHDAMPLPLPHPHTTATETNTTTRIRKPTTKAATPAAVGHEQTTAAAEGSADPPYVFSCVTVPPPVPAAVPAFQAHVRALRAGLGPLAFITLTSNLPYFAEAATGAAPSTGSSPTEQQKDTSNSADDDGGGCGDAAALSATQAAVEFLLDDDDAHNASAAAAATPVVLSVVATRATHTQQQQVGEGTAASSLTGASRGGIAAVLGDFEARLRRREGAVGGLMLLRGDDQGYTRRRALLTADVDSSSSGGGQSPYRDFRDGAELLHFCAARLRPPYQRRHQHQQQQQQEEEETANHQNKNNNDNGKEEEEVSSEQLLSIFTGGYPQGHSMERLWAPAAETAPEEIHTGKTISGGGGGADGSKAEETEGGEGEARRRSLLFLQNLDSVLAATNLPRRPNAAAAAATEEDALRELTETVGDAQKLLRRATDGACRLGEVPSALPAPFGEGLATPATGGARADTPRAAEAEALARSVRHALVREKLLPLPLSKRTTSSSSPAATTTNVDNGDRVAAGEKKKRRRTGRVVVTQMVSSADEFIRYSDAVYSEVQTATAAAAAASEEEEVVVVVVPGVMAPLPPDEYARVVLQLKVVPSPTLLKELQRYVRGLEAALLPLQSAIQQLQREGRGDEMEEHGANARAATEAEQLLTVFRGAKGRLDADFVAKMEEETVEMCRGLRARGYRHINFSCFSYSCAPAAARVARQLQRVE